MPRVEEMIPVVPFEPGRFRSTAGHYHARPAYSPRLIGRVAELCRLTPSDRLLDPGCGIGPLAIAFRPCVGSVLAVDPEPEMLARAAVEAKAKGLQIEFRAGSSADRSVHAGQAGRVSRQGRASRSGQLPRRMA